MARPADCTARAGEWIEIYNDWVYDVALDGLMITTNAGTVTIDDDVAVIGPGDTFLARRAGSFTNCYPELVHDFVYPGVALSNSGDHLLVSNSHTVLDEVDFSSWVIPVGASLMLDPIHLSASENDDILSWCPSTDPIDTVGSDLGTPGVANAPCVAPDTDTGSDVLSIDQVVPGELVISEVLLWNLECGATVDQYIEIYNASDSAIDLNGMRIRNEVSFSNVVGAVVVQAGDYAVGRTSVPQACLSYNADFTFTNFTFRSEANIFYIEYDTVTFDSVNMTGWGDANGSAFQVMPENVASSTNSDEIDWCLAAVPIPGHTTNGTPGEANNCEPPVVDTDVDTDADTDVDTGLPPTSVTVAYSRGKGDVAPGVSFNGVHDFRLETVDFATDEVDTQCFQEFSLVAVSLVTTPCQTCEFSFELQRTYAVDVRQQALGLPSECGTVFPMDVSGATALPNLIVGYSSAYGGLFYESGTDFLVYTYNTEYSGSRFEFTRYFQQTYYY
jgi:hypothetical protein